MVHQAIVKFDEPYTHQAIVHSLSNSTLEWIISTDIENTPKTQSYKSLQWLEYELIDWDQVADRPDSVLVNAYCIRKGLIRKSQFAYNITKYLSKRPDSILKRTIPETWLFELDHVDYFDEAMNEVFEVERELEANKEMAEGERRHKFIIKPSMTNKAAGIHVFDSLEQLYAIFEEQEEDSEDDENDDGREDMTHVREWVIQRYIDNPLLVNRRKFHVRAYVLAVSNIQVYLYRDMLALFALREYSSDDLSDILVHLTNTCIQVDEVDYVEQASVQSFWNLKDVSKDGQDKACLDKAFAQMQAILADVFDACTSEMTTFQALPNAFELFGVDFLLDEDMNVYFLEANAFPDFKQTGTKLQNIIQELFDATTKTAVEPFFGIESEKDERFVKVFDRELLSL